MAAIVLFPIWLCLSVIITAMYMVGYIRGDNNIKDFWNVKHQDINKDPYSDVTEFDIHAN